MIVEVFFIVEKFLVEMPERAGKVEGSFSG